jgi:DnaK suppressor protein
MGIPATGIDGLKAALERKEAELAVMLRRRDGIEIQKSADQMDEIQYATERDLAISNVDRDSSLLRQVKAALLRIREDAFGSCVECESAIGPKRLVAVPWAARCIRCQEIADRDRQDRAESLAEPLSHAA